MSTGAEVEGGGVLGPGHRGAGRTLVTHKDSRCRREPANNRDAEMLAPCGHTSRQGSTRILNKREVIHTLNAAQTKQKAGFRPWLDNF